MPNICPWIRHSQHARAVHIFFSVTVLRSDQPYFTQIQACYFLIGWSVALCHLLIGWSHHLGQVKPPLLPRLLASEWLLDLGNKCPTLVVVRNIATFPDTGTWQLCCRQEEWPVDMLPTARNQVQKFWGAADEGRWLLLWLWTLYKPINILWMSTFAPSQRHLKTSVSSLNWCCNDKVMVWETFMHEEGTDLGCDVQRPRGCDSLLAPLCSNLSCGVMADVELRHKNSHPRAVWLLSRFLYLLLHSTIIGAAHAAAVKYRHWGTHRCASWDICRANPAPTKGFTDATAVTDTLMFHKKVASKQMRDRSLMSWFQTLQFFAPTESLLLTFPAPFLVYLQTCFQLCHCPLFFFLYV